MSASVAVASLELIKLVADETAEVREASKIDSVDETWLSKLSIEPEASMHGMFVFAAIELIALVTEAEIELIVLVTCANSLAP